jgi:hypothetical protein
MARLTKDNVELGMGATTLGWSDRHSHTVIAISENKNKITLQRDKAVSLTKPEFTPGGFSAVCINNVDIEYEITPDPNGGLINVYSKKNGEYWFDKPVIVGRNEYYDHNF